MSRRAGDGENPKYEYPLPTTPDYDIRGQACRGKWNPKRFDTSAKLSAGKLTAGPSVSSGRAGKSGAPDNNIRGQVFWFDGFGSWLVS